MPAIDVCADWLTLYQQVKEAVEIINRYHGAVKFMERDDETLALKGSKYETKKEWRCLKCGSVLGYVISKNHIDRLDIQDRGIVATGQVEVCCFECGAVREWYIGKDTLESLFEKLKSKNKN